MNSSPTRHRFTIVLNGLDNFGFVLPKRLLSGEVEKFLNNNPMQSRICAKNHLVRPGPGSKVSVKVERWSSRNTIPFFEFLRSGNVAIM